jgi:hypothetical protein
MKKTIISGCMILGLLIFTQSAVAAQYDYELAYGYSGRDSWNRDAVEMDDWLERGRGAVTESPIFADGIRLTAWGGEETYEPGLASAIYCFSVPRWAQYLKISIRYRDTAQDDKIAGRLWIKSTENDMRGVTATDEEAPLYGDTFVLRSERSSETITVPTNRHVEDGRVEMHVVAEGSDCIDIRDIRVEYLDTRPQITVVNRTYNDYWNRWPRHRYAYHYYYWGPLFWPKTLVVYECWDIPNSFYWITWRPWFFINIIRVHHHFPWWGPRRYTVVYHSDVKQPPIKKRHLIRKRLKERHVHVTKIIRPNPLIRKTVPRPVRTKQPRQQEVRLNKETTTPRTAETTVNHNPTQKHLKEQPVRADKGREKPIMNTQAQTVKRPQVSNKPNPPSTRSSHTAPQHRQEAQSKPRTTEQQSRPRSITQEKTVQEPVKKQLQKKSKEIPKANTVVKPTPIRRDNQEQPALEKQQPERLATNKKIKAVKRPQVTNKSDSRSALPFDTTAQPRTAKQQSQSRSLAREAVREPTKVHATQNHRIKQGQTVQKDAKIGKVNKPQSRREIRQERPRAEQRRPR